MVLNEGSLRNITMGVFTGLHIDMQNADKIRHSIMVSETLNDPVLYIALLPESWVTNPPQQAPDRRPLAWKAAAGSSSRTSQEA